MAASFAAQIGARSFLTNRSCICYQPVRFRRLWRHPGKRHVEASRLSDRLADINKKEQEKVINIGLPLRQPSLDPHSRHRAWSKSREGKEQAARQRTLIVPLEKVKDQWRQDAGAQYIRGVAQHYGIYEHMFDSAIFYPLVDLNISYDYDEEFVTPVCWGNQVPPAEAAVQPYVHFESPPDTLWTLVMSSPDGHLQDNNSECLHWMVANIPGNQVEQGETIREYMQPFPPKGVGHLRYVFVLYKQDEAIDLSKEKISGKCLSLQERTFSSLDFYGGHQDVLTPAGLAFFQAEWDPSVRSFFRQVLDMPEPVFEFMHPPPYHPKQVRYPHRKPFNLYLDRYKDIKEIEEEVLKERLKRTSPFQENKPEIEFPNAVPLPLAMPSWLKTRIKNMRLRRHQWKDLPRD